MSETTTVDEDLVDTADDAAGDDAMTSELELLPPGRTPDMAAIGTLREHVGAMRDAKFFADGICYTSMVPDRFRGKPGDGAAAILFGAELGLSPIASLRSIIVIHGQPGLEARTMKALLKSKGYRFKTYEATDEACDIEAWSPDGSESERCRFTMADAVKAEWVPVEVKPGEYEKNTNGKLKGNMKYLTEPRNMMRAKATAVVCREIAPHILLGMPYSRDDLEDWASTTTAEWGDGAPQVVRPAGGSGINGVRAARERREAQRAQERDVVDAETTDEPPPAAADSPPPAAATTPSAAATGGGMSQQNRRKWLNRMFQLLNDGDCPDRDDQLLVIAAAAAAAGIPGLRLEHRDDLTDEQLRVVVTQFNDWNKASKLGSEITEILNRAALAEMESEAKAEAASEQAAEDKAEADLAAREAEAEGATE